MLETGGFWNKGWVIRTFHQRKTSYYCEGSRWGNKNNPVQDNFQLAYFSVCYFVIQALQFSNIYIPCDDHISLFPYPAPHTQLKAKLIFLDESTNSVLRSLFLFLLCCYWAGPQPGDVASFSPSSLLWRLPSPVHVSAHLSVVFVSSRNLSFIYASCEIVKVRPYNSNCF